MVVGHLRLIEEGASLDASEKGLLEVFGNSVLGLAQEAREASPVAVSCAFPATSN